MVTDESALFDVDDIEAVATEYAIGAASLADALATHQQSVEDLPGIENIAYEWRKQYEDPLLARTQSAYYFALPATIWHEFDFSTEVSDTQLTEALSVSDHTRFGKAGARKAIELGIDRGAIRDIPRQMAQLGDSEAWTMTGVLYGRGEGA